MRTFTAALLYGIAVALALALIDVFVWHFQVVWAVRMAVAAGILAGVAVRFPKTGAAMGAFIIWVIVVPWTFAFIDVHWAEPGRTLIAWLALGSHALPTVGPFFVRALRPSKRALA